LKKIIFFSESIFFQPKIRHFCEIRIIIKRKSQHLYRKNPSTVPRQNIEPGPVYGSPSRSFAKKKQSRFFKNGIRLQNSSKMTGKNDGFVYNIVVYTTLACSVMLLRSFVPMYVCQIIVLINFEDSISRKLNILEYSKRFFVFLFKK
jgi:hypothetical protein